MKTTLKTVFEFDDGDRAYFMSEQRKFAAYTIASILPWYRETRDYRGRKIWVNEIETHQSIGARGTEVMAGSIISALFPAGFLWHEFALPLERYDFSQIDPRIIQNDQDILYAKSMLINLELEVMRYRSAYRQLINNMLVVGNGLGQFVGRGKEEDPYRIKNYRLDQWVTRRNGAGDVLYVLAREMIDPMTMDQRQIEDSGLDADKLADKMIHERMMEMYTYAEWQPRKRSWNIVQEVNDHVITELEEKVSPFIVAQYMPVPGSDYGRGLAEINNGDLRGMNASIKAMLEIAAAAAKLLVVNDQNQSGILNEQLASDEQGKIINGRVTQDGRPVAVGFLTTNKSGDFSMINALASSIEVRLAKSYMLESELQPRGDRVTAFQSARIAREIESGLGGAYSMISDQIQPQTIERMIFQLRRDGKMAMPKPEEQFITSRILTGLAALNKDAELQKMLVIPQALSPFPEALRMIDQQGYAKRVIQLSSLSPVGLIKSQDQLDEEAAQERRMAFDQAVTQKAIDTIGNVTENIASQ